MTDVDSGSVSGDSISANTLNPIKWKKVKKVEEIKMEDPKPEELPCPGSKIRSGGKGRGKGYGKGKGPIGIPAGEK